MNTSKSARYALYAAMEMAAAPEGSPVTAAEVARRYELPPAVVAKVFQRLVRAGLALGTRGVTGGYQLGRDASSVTLFDIVSIFDPPRPGGACSLHACGGDGCSLYRDCRLRHVFDEIDELARTTLASVTLATLVAPRQPLARAIAGGR